MCRGGSRPGTGVKKGEKRGPYTKKAATKKRSEPSAASTAMLAAFVASGNTDEAPQDELDGGAHELGVDDKSTVPTWAPAGRLQRIQSARSITTTTWAEVRAREDSPALACGLLSGCSKQAFLFSGARGPLIKSEGEGGHLTRDQLRSAQGHGRGSAACVGAVKE